MLIPVLSSARRSSNIQTSLSNMRQLHQAMEIYRSNWSSSDSLLAPRSLGDLGLPPASEFGPGLLGLSNSLFVSPCGPDETIHRSGLGGVNGYIFYAPSAYDPTYTANPNNVHHGYLEKYGVNAALFVDQYCNAKGTNMMERTLQKRALAVLISGQAINRNAMGNAATLFWYSDLSQ
jgi:hypothetical protein